MENSPLCQVCLRIDNCNNDTSSIRSASGSFICRNCWDIPNTNDTIDTTLHVDQLMRLSAAAETSHLTKYATDHYREENTLTDGRCSNINDAQNNNLCLNNNTLSNDDANKFINKTMDKNVPLLMKTIMTNTAALNLFALIVETFSVQCVAMHMLIRGKLETIRSKHCVNLTK